MFVRESSVLQTCLVHLGTIAAAKLRTSKPLFPRGNGPHGRRLSYKEGGAYESCSRGWALQGRQEANEFLERDSSLCSVQQCGDLRSPRTRPAATEAPQLPLSPVVYPGSTKAPCSRKDVQDTSGTQRSLRHSNGLLLPFTAWAQLQQNCAASASPCASMLCNSSTVGTAKCRPARD
jgi:hypothetical protein